MACIGIDLGTTHACVGVFHNEKVHILANNQGVRTTPCYITFGEDPVVGEGAVEKSHSNVRNTLFHLKHALGKSYEEVNNSHYSKHWTFEITKDAQAQPIVHVSIGEATTTVSVEKFCGLLIEEMKRLAEDFTGETVEHAVITVPSHFDTAQRDALRRAAAHAKVEVLNLVDESIAACIAYNLDEDSSPETSVPEYVVVYDLGGATHDVSLICVDNGMLRILSSTSGNRVGGETFTNALVDHCLQAFQKQHPTIDLSTNPRALGRLKLACEAAKRSLSQQTRAIVEVDSIAEGIDLIVKVSRSRFEDLIVDAVSSTLQDIDTVLEQGDLDKVDVGRILMVGGSVHIPLVQTKVEKMFPGKHVVRQIIPDEAIATGATIEAQTLFRHLEHDIPTIDAVPAMPLSVGLAAADGSMFHLLHRDTLLPATCTETFTTETDGQTGLLVEIYEGERLLAKDNTLLVQFAINGLTALPKGQVQVHLTLTVQTSGLLCIRAQEGTNGVEKRLEIPPAADRLSPQAVQQLIQEAEEAAEADEAELEALEELALAAQLQESVLAAPVGNSDLQEDMD